MSLLLLSTPERARAWRPIFDAAGETLIVGEDAVTDPADITHIVCWMPPADPGRYPNLRAVISTGAGVDQMPDLPPGVALTRTIAPGIDDMVRDWVVMATLMLHRDMPLYLEQAAQGEWARPPDPLRRQRACRHHGQWAGSGARRPRPFRRLASMWPVTAARATPSTASRSMANRTCPPSSRAATF